MAIAQSRLPAIGALFMFVLVSGILLTREGRPYAQLLFNVHKLIALGAFAVLAATVVGVGRVTSFGSIELLASIATGVLFVVTIISGGLSNVDTMPGFVVWLHRVSTFVTLAASALTLYLVTSSG